MVITQLCAPVKKLLSSDKVDLFEIDHQTHKLLYDKEGQVRYIDIDWKRKFPETSTPVIVSYHNFDKTPDLESTLAMLQQAHPKAHFYKIATMALSTLDSLRMLLFLQKHKNVIGVCMGELGALTRICAPIFGVPIMYAPLLEEDKSAPGQLLASQLLEIFHFRKLNPSTRLFGLIGDPVFRSLGHLFHNDTFRQKNYNGVYLKMVVKPEELPLFFSYVKQLPFEGLSVTAPLKEAILPFLDHVDPAVKEIGAANTIVFQQGELIGYNTDGEAALDVLGEVAGKRVVILGAGGASKALVYTAVKRGARVVVVNRSHEKTKALAEIFGCEWNETVPPYDFLVNATSATLPVEPHDLVPRKTVMDISVYETEFLKEAKRRKCEVIDGLPMFFQQAVAQQKIWFRLTPATS